MRSFLRLFFILCLCMGGATISLALDEGEIECETDADCPSGLECIETPCPAIACAPGEDCPPIDCYSVCGPPEPEVPEAMTCEVDDDCPAYFSCEEFEIPCDSAPIAVDCPTCACPDCPPEEECEPCDCPPCEESEPVEPEECTPETIKMCRFQEVDCTDNADACDAGFQCQEVQECSMSSSGSAGSSGGLPATEDPATDCACTDCAEGEDCPPCECEENDQGGADSGSDPVDEPEESCEVTGAICVPEEVECEDATDCLDGWECVQNESGAVSVGCECAACPPCPPCAEGEDCEPCEECPPCECDDIELPEEESTSVCLPEGWAELLSSGWVGGEDALIGTPAATEPGTSDGTSEPPSASPNEENSEGADKGSSESSGGGCAATSTSNTDAFAYLVLILSLAAIMRRRFSYES